MKIGIFRMKILKNSFSFVEVVFCKKIFGIRRIKLVSIILEQKILKDLLRLQLLVIN